jgi:hypothetical protein
MPQHNMKLTKGEGCRYRVGNVISADSSFLGEILVGNDWWLVFKEYSSEEDGGEVMFVNPAHIQAIRPESW